VFIVTDAALGVILNKNGATVIVLIDDLPLSVAVIVAVPALIPVTSPVALTVATAVLLDDHAALLVTLIFA
jgi:hypothetical protein